jgi:uncharacterized protein YeaO (DUF488 family)
MTDTPQVRLRRVYDEPSRADGTRILVDGVWPRGLRKDQARIDEWLKQVAPSTQLRQWYGHDPDRFAEFTRRYLIELANPDRAEAVEQLRKMARDHTVTLLTATKDIEHSQAAVLVSLIQD